MEISDCIYGDSNLSPILITNENCTGDEVDIINGLIQFHHVTFKENFNGRYSSCLHSETGTCSALELIDVEFDSNVSGGPFVIGQLPPLTNMSDVNIINNIYDNDEINDSISFSTLFDMANGYQLNADQIIAKDNIKAFVFNLNDNNYLKLTNSLFEFNNGVLQANHSKLEIRDSSFMSNDDINMSGKVINSLNSDLTLHDSIISGNKGINSAALDLICTELCHVSIVLSKIENNRAEMNGAGLSATGLVNISISNSSFRNNSVDGLGGAIYMTSPEMAAELNIEDSTFKENEAEFGASLYLKNVLMISERNELLENTSGKSGGAISATDSDLNIKNTIIINNHAYEDGGGIYITNDELDSKLTAENSIFESNSAKWNGGAIYKENDGMMEFLNVTFDGNFVDGSGGAIYHPSQFDSAQIVIEESIFNSNYAGYSAGAIHISGNFELHISDSNYIKNGAFEFGGSLDLEGVNTLPTCYIENTVFNTNYV